MPANISETHLQRTLVVQTAFLGDVLLTIPLLRAVKAAGAEYLHVVTSPAGADALRDVKEIDVVQVMDKRRTHRSFSATWNTGLDLKRLRFTSALVPHRSLRSAVLALASKTQVRVGFSSSEGGMFLTHTVTAHVSLPEVQRNLLLLTPFHLQQQIISEPWFLPPRERDKNGDISIVIAPGSQWGAKQWPLVHFSALVEYCLSSGWKVVVTGSVQEMPLCEELCREFSGQEIVNKAGSTSWVGYKEILTKATVVVANDTAAVHAANLVRSPVVALFGPTVPEFGFAPRGLFDAVIESHGLVCRPCNAHGGKSCPLGTHLCMTELSPNRVFEAVRKIVQRINVPS